MTVSIICRVFTGELPYIKSFLDHYILIGVNTFYILNTIVEEYDDVRLYLKEYINNNFVKLYNISSNKVRIQGCVKEILKHVNEEYIFYCDIDEYLILSDRFNTIHDLVISDEYDQYKIKWLYYFNDTDRCILDKNIMKTPEGKCIMKVKSIENIGDHCIMKCNAKIKPKTYTYKIDMKNNPYILHIASRTFNDTLIKCVIGRIRDRKFKFSNIVKCIEQNDIPIKLKLLALYNIIESKEYNCNVKVDAKKVDISYDYDYDYEKYLLEKSGITGDIIHKIKILYNNFKEKLKISEDIEKDIKKNNIVRIALIYAKVINEISNEIKPNYICIGVQKGGTTSLKRYLNYHPEIFSSGEKHLFDKPLSKGELTTKHIKKYETSFNTNKLIVGEKTPSYNYLRYAMDRIYNYNKNIKLIILLREPISRAFSQYNMELMRTKKTLNDVTEEQMLHEFKKEEHIKLHELQSNGMYFIIRGFYDEILEYILSKFPRNNLYIGISEEINKNKLKYYNEIYNFLGTTSLEKIDKNLNAHTRRYSKTIPKNLENYLHNIYKPHNEKLYKILGRKIEIWENYYNQLK